MARRILSVMCAAGVLGLISSMATGAPLPFAEIGDVNNAAHSTGYGSVDHEYWVGVYEVTNAQYADFLNAVGDADPQHLYNADMPGITRSGPPDSYVYDTVTGYEDHPVTYVNWYDAARYCNWLHNGKPTAPQGETTTEDGAYDVNGTAVRQDDALYFLPTEDQWYKAAYYKGGGTDAGYWLYPTQSDDDPTAEDSPGGANSANFDAAVADTTGAGAYGSATSAYGTFDQAGNVWEWLETEVVGLPVEVRLVGGGSYTEGRNWLRANEGRAGIVATTEDAETGFRVGSMVPEPMTLTLLLAGSGVALLRRRRR